MDPLGVLQDNVEVIHSANHSFTTDSTGDKSTRVKVLIKIVYYYPLVSSLKSCTSITCTKLSAVENMPYSMYLQSKVKPF